MDGQMEDRRHNNINGHWVRKKNHNKIAKGQTEREMRKSYGEYTAKKGENKETER